MKLFEELLFKEKNCTRDELALELKKAKIRTDENRMSHLLLHAELNGLICSGPLKGNKISYSLLSERVREKKTYNREESLANLTRRYFSSHYPATISDFCWWAGASLKDARNGLQSIRNDFHSEKIDKEEYWLPNLLSDVGSGDPFVALLPAYDEFLISYKSRKASLSLMDGKRVVSVNGIFKPTVTLNGQVVGLWRKSDKNKVMVIEADLVQKTDHIEQLLEDKFTKYGLFLGKKVDLQIRYDKI